MIQKNIKKLCVVMLILLLSLGTISYAEKGQTSQIQPKTLEVPNTSEVSESKQEIINDDVILNGTSITIDQEIYGNAYIVASKSVTVSAPIHGNVYVFSTQSTFETSEPDKPVVIDGSLFIYGTDINLNVHCQDLYVFAATSLNISSRSIISRDARINVPTLNLYGTVERNAFIDSENINLKAKDEEHGTILGNLSYYNINKLDISEDAVEGSIYFNEKTANTTPQWLSSLYSTFSRFITAMLFLILLTRITPDIVNPQKGFILKKFLGTLLYGILTLIIIPVVCFALVSIWPKLFIFAIPVIFIYGGLIITGFFTSMIYFAGLLRNSIFKKNSSWITLILLLIINLIIYIASFFIIAAIVIAIALAVFGFGLLTQELFKKRSSDNITFEESSKSNKKNNKK